VEIKTKSTKIELQSFEIAQLNIIFCNIHANYFNTCLLLLPGTTLGDIFKQIGKEIDKGY
jgi:hypothetical protein